MMNALGARLAGGPMEGQGTRMVDYELLREEGILVIRPQSALEAADFQRVAHDVDPYIEANGKMRGVMVEAKSFPGWKDFASLIAHLKFVKDHHRKIEKVAVVAIAASLARRRRLPAISFRPRSGIFRFGKLRRRASGFA
jgi:hypothetical protein